MRPGEGRQTLHSDVPLAMHRYGDDAPLMMNTVWALSDLNPDGGGTRLVPGMLVSGTTPARPWASPRKHPSG